MCVCQAAADTSDIKIKCTRTLGLFLQLSTHLCRKNRHLMKKCTLASLNTTPKMFSFKLQYEGLLLLAKNLRIHMIKRLMV